MKKIGADERYINLRNRIVVQLKRYSLNSIVIHARNVLFECQNGANYAPWHASLLIELAFISKSQATRNVTLSEFRKLYRQMDALASATKGIKDLPGFHFWMRRMAFQQFPYKYSHQPEFIVRQQFLFGVSDNPRLAAKFQELHGMSVEEFSQWAFVLMGFSYAESTNTFTPLWFKTIEKFAAPKGPLTKILNILSIDQRSLKRRIESKYKNERGERIHFDEAVFFHYPLYTQKTTGLWHFQKYSYFHKAFLQRRLMDFAYDSLRENGANEFMGHFGPALERYTKRLLDYAQLNYLGEKELKQKVTKAGRVADFVIEEENALIILEVKGVEPSTTAKTTALPNILARDLKKSILHAVTQGQRTARALGNSLTSEKKVFQIILTYKQHYLATGEIFEACIGPDILEGVLVDESGETQFGRDELFLMSLDEFESLIEGVRQGETTFGTFLLQVQRDQKSRRDKAFVLRQHLAKQKIGGFPEFFKSTVDTSFDELISRVSD